MTAEFPDAGENLEVTVDFVSGLRSDENAEFSLLDCREEDEFAFCRIEGAQLAPLSRFAEAALPLLPENRERPIVIYCHHGVRSAQAARFLRARGFPNAFSLAGGIEAWSVEIDSRVPRY